MGRKLTDEQAFANLTEEERSQAMWNAGRAEAGAHGIKYHERRGNSFQADDCRRQLDAGLDAWNAAMEVGRSRG